MAKELELEIEKVIWRGRALAHLKNGKAVIVVGGAFPKEVVKALPIREKKDYIEAYVQKIIKKHPTRREHPCPNSDLCGGCRWGGVWEWFQWILKKYLLIKELKRQIKDFSFPEHKINIYPSPKNWRYRLRAQIHVKDGTPYFMKLNSNELVKLDDCLLLDKELADSLFDLSKDLPDGRFVVAFDPINKRAFHEREKVLIKLPLENLNSYILVYPSSFFQANWDLNKYLVKYVCSLLKGIERVADLYAGAGNFSVPLAKTQKCSVLAVEVDPLCVQSLKICSQELNISNLKVIQKEIGKDSLFSILKDFSPHAAVIDPPRSGAGKNIIEINNISSLKKMVWISCDVVNTIRDIKPFLKMGWEIKSIDIFDMFPQTWHMETVFTLERQ